MTIRPGAVVAVTGSGSGIGLATCERLLAEGAVVHGADVAPAPPSLAEHERYRHTQLDVTDTAALDTVLRDVEADVLVANAGGTMASSHEMLTADLFRLEIDLNLEAAYRVTKAVLPSMITKGRGALVYIASVNGLFHVGNPGYSAAKAGLINLMRTLAVEYGPRGIRANCVSPGTIDTGNKSWARRRQRDPNIMATLTKWYPVGRVGRAEDIAAAVAFLAADEAGFVNGANLVVDGGLTAGIAPMIAELVVEDKPIPGGGA